MSASNDIKFDFPELISFFKSRFGDLIVPDYQRGFDWNTGHVEDLWEDIHNYVEKFENGEEEDFFVGTIILKDPEENFKAKDKKRYEIVDGQQRLTSFYLLAIAIRQKFKEFDKDDPYVKEIDSDFINSYETDANRKRQPVPKLLGTKKIRPVLNYISHTDWNGEWPSKLNLPDMDGRTLNAIVRKLKVSLQSHLDEMEGNGFDSLPYDYTKLENLYEVFKRIKIVVLGVKTSERAFYLFETTNARGKDLEPGDLLKNHLFRTIPEVEKEKIYDRWEDVVENSSNKLIIMLKHFYYVHDSHVQKKDLYKKLKNLHNDNTPQLLDDIEHYSKFHFLMHRGSINDFIDYFSNDLGIYDRAQGITKFKGLYRSISALRYFKSELSYPVIYAFLVRLSKFLVEEKVFNSDKDKNKKSALKKLLPRTLEAFENFQFINYKICSNKGNKIEKPYAEYAGNIYKSKSLGEFLSSLEILFTFMRTNINGIGTFEENFIKISASDKDNNLIHYIFHKLEESRTGNILAEEIFDPKRKALVYDVEHFAPQELSTHMNNEEEYDEYLEIHKEITSNEDNENLIDNIGNLVSMDKNLNQNLSNMIPRKKLKFISDNKGTGSFIMHSFLDDFKVSKILESEEISPQAPGPKFNTGDILRTEALRIENNKIIKDGKNPAKSEQQTWNAGCITNRAKELAKECYTEVFAVAEHTGPKISKQEFKKLTE